MRRVLALMPSSPFLPRLLYNLRYLGQTGVGKVRRWGRDVPRDKLSLLGFFSCACGLFPPFRSVSVRWQRGAGLGHPHRAGEALGHAGERRG